MPRQRAIQATEKENRARAAAPARRADPRSVLQRARAAPQTLTRADVLTLQRTIGNRATTGIIQPKLTLGSTVDPAEQEADRVAKQVVRSFSAPAPAAPVQREEWAGDALQMKPLAASITSLPRAAFRKPALQRFPANVFTTPYDGWLADAPAISSPGEGAKGGVYFLRSNAGPVNSVVVKPLVDESPAQSQFGDQLLQIGFGIDTPNSRIVTQGSAEFQALFTLIKPHADNKKPPEKTPEEQMEMMQEDQAAYMEYMNAMMGYVPIEETKAFKVMEKVNASSLAKIAGEADDQGKVDRLLSIMRNNALLQQIGVLAIADALMGNDDRLTISGVKRMTNLGNYMISDNDELFAIDTATRLETLTDPRQIAQVQRGGTSASMLLNTLGEPSGARALADLFMDAVAEEVAKAPVARDFNPATYYNGQMAGLAGNVRTQIATGIQNGLTMIKNIMTGATVQDQQKQDQLRNASQETYGAGGRHLASFDTLEGNLAYLESYTSARQSGLNAGAAETAGKVAASKTLMAQQGHDDTINALKAVDVAALSLDMPRGFDKKAKSARRAVENVQVEPREIQKWVGKYKPDLHIHALRVAQAIQEKRVLIRGAVAIVRELSNDTNQLAHVQLQAYAQAYHVVEQQIVNLLRAAGRIMVRLNEIDERKYAGFIDFLRQAQNVLQHTQRQFAQNLN